MMQEVVILLVVFLAVTAGVYVGGRLFIADLEKEMKEWRRKNNIW